MSYNQSDIDLDSNVGFGPWDGEIVKAGVGINKRYGTPVMTFVCRPPDPSRRSQLLSYSMGTKPFEFGGNPEVFITGEGEKSFETKIQSEIVSGPHISIMTKAGLFLNALKHLGFAVETGDMSEYLGLRLVFEEIGYNTAIEQFNSKHPESKLPELTGENKDAKITMPIKILEIPAKEVPLSEQVLAFIATEKTENEVIAWCNESGSSKKEVFANLDSEIEGGHIVFDGKTYMRKEGETEI